jgi:Asp-tRNA(Asn)/Glu-tRNA(Gln) amidotransferase B subunit
MIKIGLEIHCPVNSSRKLFCNCNRNIEVCPICRGQPGSYPLVPSEQILNSYKKILKLYDIEMNQLVFERKHYQYPDLPKGFQITTKRENFKSEHNIISFIALEEDPASIKNTGVLKIDYSRCGNPLFEIVTLPCFTSESQVSYFYEKLLKTLEFNELKADKEPLRVDVNISIVKEGVSSKKIEIKNLHSITNIIKCISYETDRLKKLSVEELVGTDETRSYDEVNNVTEFSRSKTSYIFLPEVNLPKICLIDQKIGKSESYEEVLLKLNKEYPSLSDEELAQISNREWYYLFSKMKTRDETYPRFFLHLLKYCQLSGYTKEEIHRALELLRNQKFSKLKIKELVIRRDYSCTRSRKEISFSEVLLALEEVNTPFKIKERLLDLEEKRILPLEDISKKYPYYK